MSQLNDYIRLLTDQGYFVMFVDDVSTNSTRAQISKNGNHVSRIIPLHDIGNLLLGVDTVKLNYLIDMRKELDAELKKDETPRWTNYQVEALTDISEALMSCADNAINESFRIKLRSIATEIKNIIPMEMVRKNGG